VNTVAGVDGLDPAELLGPFGEQVGELAQGAPAFGRGRPRPRPLGEGAVRGPDRALDVRLGRRGDARPRHARRRVDARERAPIGGVDPLPVDEHLVPFDVAHRRRPSRDRVAFVRRIAAPAKPRYPAS
jgi:hypothetical protein